MCRALCFFSLAVMIAGVPPAFAQSPAAGPSLVFGIAAGPARRTVFGTFAPAARPAGAAPVQSHRVVTTFGLQAGVKLSRHIALLGVWDQTFGGNSGSARWGMSDVHAVGRVWLGRLWLQAGGGLSELGYKATTGPGVGIDRFWAPGLDASVGADMLQGRRVAVVVAGRASRATFEGQTITRVGLEIGLFGRR